MDISIVIPLLNEEESIKELFDWISLVMSKQSLSYEVIFIDDVLFTGRSINAALSAIQSFGRPLEVELMVLIDRRFSRHLPIQPDYRGRQVDAIKDERIKVSWKENGGEDSIYLEKATTPIENEGN